MRLKGLLPADIAGLTIPQTLIELDLEPKENDDGTLADRVRRRQFSVFDDVRHKKGLRMEDFCALPPAVLAEYVSEAIGGRTVSPISLPASVEQYRKERT